MTCILRASGTTFEADHFIARTSLVTDSLWRKGEKRFPLNKAKEATNDSSGIRILASEADFSNLSQQIEDVILFLRQNQTAVTELASFPGVESAVL